MNDQVLLAGPVIRLNQISDDRRRVEWVRPPEKFPLPLFGNFNLDEENPNPVIMPIGEIIYAAPMPDQSWWILAWIDPAHAPERGEDYDVGTELSIHDVELEAVEGLLPSGSGSELVEQFMPNGVLTVKDASLDAVVAYISMGASAYENVWLRRPPERDQDEFWDDEDWESFQSIMTEWSMIQAGFITPPLAERP